MPSTEPIIALFDEAGQARRLRDELCRAGLSPDEMTLILPSPAAASARAEVVDRLIGAGIPKPDAPLFADEVCGGATLLAIRPAEAERARVIQISAATPRHGAWPQPRAANRRAATLPPKEPRSYRCRPARARWARAQFPPMTEIGSLPGSVAFFRYASQQCRIPGAPSCTEPL